MIDIDKKTETNTQQSIFDMFVWKTVNVLQLQKNVQKIIIFLHFNLFLYMYLRIHLLCCKFHLCPRQHGVPLILKNLHICLKWLLTLKKKREKKLYTHYYKYLPRAWIHRSITKRVQNCCINHKHYPLHVHIQCLIVLSMRQFPLF